MESFYDEFERVYKKTQDDLKTQDSSVIIRDGNFAYDIVKIITKEDQFGDMPEMELYRFILKKLNEWDSHEEITDTEICLLDIISHLCYIVKDEINTKNEFLNDFKTDINGWLYQINKCINKE